MLLWLKIKWLMALKMDDGNSDEDEDEDKDEDVGAPRN